MRKSGYISAVGRRHLKTRSAAALIHDKPLARELHLSQALRVADGSQRDTDRNLLPDEDIRGGQVHQKLLRGGDLFDRGRHHLKGR